MLCSPLERARETCARSGLIDAAQITDDLMEWDYGVYEGRTTEEIRLEIPDWSIWTSPVPGGESPEQVGSRVDNVIARVLDAPDPVALFAHAHVLRVLAARWVGLAATTGAAFALDTASVSTLGFERSTPVITGWNNTSHLLGSGHCDDQGHAGNPHH